MTDDLVALLRTHGLPATGVVVGSGMEGTVLALADGHLAKVWHTRGRAELERLRTFHAAVAAAGLPFAVPEVLDVLDVGAHHVTVQPHLVGVPLWDRPGVSPPQGRLPVLGELLAGVLAALAAVPPAPAMAVLPVLDGETPFGSDVSFAVSLAMLVESRATPLLDPSTTAGVTAALRTLPSAPIGLLHGDLVPGNLLVVDGRVSAVLDFGFLSTLGDPTFDAAVTASIADMYGEHARRTEAHLDEVFGHDPGRVALYRLAYALVTATCYSASGSDGHFAWCAAMLARRDLLDAAGV